jgi:GH25 family lysozyme M1 (1,4-beta-N-acetylmuramidase)
MACCECGGKYTSHPRLPTNYRIRFDGRIEVLPLKFYVLDVSTYQRELDFDAIKAMGIVHAIVVRLTIGDIFDKLFESNIARIMNSGMPWMGYQGTTPGTNGKTAYWDPESEADAYLRAIAKLCDTYSIQHVCEDTLHWMDIESGDEESRHDDQRLDNGLNKDQISLWNMVARDRIYRTSLIDMGLYSYYSYLKHEMRACYQPRLWMADYRGKQPQPIPKGYPRPMMIQVGQANDPDFPGLGTIDGTDPKTSGKIDVNYGAESLSRWLPAPCGSCGCPI